MHAEACGWNPPATARGRTPSGTRRALEGMAPGDVQRVQHDDVCCNWPGEGCTCANILSRLALQGRRYESYHEAPHVAVVRRVA